MCVQCSCFCSTARGGPVIKTEGRGKQATDKVVHVCQKCGSHDAFCCVMKKGGSTKE
jgi:hypothetical protein